jgi:hypothetical protein
MYSDCAVRLTRGEQDFGFEYAKELRKRVAKVFRGPEDRTYSS